MSYTSVDSYNKASDSSSKCSKLKTGCAPITPCKPCKPTCRRSCADRPVDCTAVINAYHEEVKEANEMFDKADRLLNDDLIKAVCYSINVLKEILDLDYNANCIMEAADKALKASGCTSGCNYNNSCCRSLNFSAEEYYMIGERSLISALELLKEVACKVNNAIAVDAEGDKLKEKYYACVHASNPDSYCNECDNSGCGCK